MLTVSLGETVKRLWVHHPSCKIVDILQSCCMARRGLYILLLIGSNAAGIKKNGGTRVIRGLPHLSIQVNGKDTAEAMFILCVRVNAWHGGGEAC